jgi:hypothetical protein
MIESRTVQIGEINVMRSEWLPAGSMVVSPDVFDLLSATPEEQAEAVAALKARVQDFQKLMAKPWEFPK